MRGIRKVNLNKRLLVFFLLLFIILFTSSAGGVAQLVTGFVVTTAGLITTVFNPLVGLSITAGGLGLLSGGYSTMESESVEKEKQKLEEQQGWIDAYNNAYSSYLQQLEMENTVSSNITSLEGSILQTQANISSFDQALTRWQSQYDQQLLSLQQQGESSYSALMQNWQGVELVNATRGQTGGSASLVAQSQLEQLERLAGADLRLDSTGGIYGTALNEFRLDMLAGRNEMIGNRNIQANALLQYRASYLNYKNQLDTIRNGILTAWKNVESNRNQAINAGVDPSKVGGGK